ncbi:MAG: YicC/YloC family endoribonuclease [Mariniblastus sp.]
MLLSMTGHGQASVEDDQVRVVAELRTVNNRFLKTNVNCDLDAAHQAKLENLIKQHVNRGSVNLRIKTQMLGTTEQYKLNAAAINSYWLQLSEIAGGSQSINIESVLQLPGLVTENVHEGFNEIAWPAVERATLDALTGLNEMRAIEGAVMEKDMLANLTTMGEQLEQIKAIAPQVIENYATKMTDRINQLLQSHDVTVDASDIIKEVGIFAEKCDVSEETVRLGSHIEQFSKVLKDDESNGKKLDFLVQEMLRETNTIGSKANNFGIANHVVEIKTAIERIREMVQNVE